jgi:hypothetical protein
VTRVLLRTVATGRKEKHDEKRSAVTVGGVKAVLIENDSWEGGVSNEGVRQQYHRCTWLEFPTPVWNWGDTAIRSGETRA